MKRPQIFTALVACLMVCLGLGSTRAADFPADDTESRRLYERLNEDYRSGGPFRNSDLNTFRDGKRSAYLSGADLFRTHAHPVPDSVLDLLPDGTWLNFKLFNQAIRGLRQILVNFPNARVRSDVVTIVDYSQRTEGRRFLVLDLFNERVLFQTWVHHGEGSDKDHDRIPEKFSNVSGSNANSAGFFLTADSPYIGMWGYSLRKHGIDGDLNSNAHERALVIHGWPAIHPRELAIYDLNQMSLGCLSLPFYESGKFYGKSDLPLNRLIIDTVKRRSAVFVSTPAIDLESKSLYLKSTALLPKATRDRILRQLTAEVTRQPKGDALPRLPEKYRDWNDGTTRPVR